MPALAIRTGRRPAGVAEYRPPTTALPAEARAVCCTSGAAGYNPPTVERGLTMRFLTLALLLSLVKSDASAAESAAELRKSLLQEPVAFRVYQRDSGGQSDIPVILASDGKATLKSAQLTGLPRDAGSQFANGKFTGVPTGGPYEMNVTVKVGDTERKLSVGPIFVGDLWVLAGQSNMQGVGDLIGVTPPHPKVMSFEMNGR